MRHSQGNLFTVVALTTLLWLAVTFATRPTEARVLHAFYATVRPPGPGWRPVAAANPTVRPDDGFAHLFVQWTAGVVLVYAALFATGYVLLSNVAGAAVSILLAAVAGAYLWWMLRRQD